MNGFFLLAVISAVLAAVSAKFHVMQKSVPRKNFVKLAEAAADVIHELVFAVQQRNLAEFDAMLLERSTPGNPLYQKWFTFEQVGEITSNPEGAKAVTDWLAEHKIRVTWQSAHQDYIKASAPISKWEELLNTKFYQWEDHSRHKAKGVQRLMHRAEEYSLPEEVKTHLSAVFNTVQVPPVFRPKYQRLTNNDEEPSFKTSFSVKPSKNLRTEADALDGTVTVSFLNEFYDIITNEGDATMSQSVFETVEESFSPTDNAQFQEMYDIPQQAAEAPYGFSTDDCITFDCYEGNLDVQYIMGVAQKTATIYWYVTENSTTDPFVAWVTDIADTADPPLANSMSWGSIEQGTSLDTLSAFNTEAMKLTSMGVTVTVSSGDNGAAEDAELCNLISSSAPYNLWTGTPWVGRGYFPSFPATSPYVTAVGATMGPEVGDPEIACQSQLGGVITTGGGFSTYNPTPSWQQEAVTAYFDGLTAGHIPTSGYNPNGRGYPDVSLIGVWYQVVVQGNVTSLFGTSASAPLFAAMVSLTNAARAKENKPALGFINPTLYAFGPTNAYFNDITSGNNKCMAYGDIADAANATCCESGFYASAGWDPLTGFGSIQYPNLAEMIENAPVSDDDKNDALSTGAIVGIAIGGAAALALVIAAAYFMMSGGSAAAGTAAAATGSVTNPVAAGAAAY